jgi:hypothetical protein
VPPANAKMESVGGLIRVFADSLSPRERPTWIRTRMVIVSVLVREPEANAYRTVAASKIRAGIVRGGRRSFMRPSIEGLFALWD